TEDEAASNVHREHVAATDRDVARRLREQGIELQAGVREHQRRRMSYLESRESPGTRRNWIVRCIVYQDGVHNAESLVPLNAVALFGRAQVEHGTEQRGLRLGPPEIHGVAERHRSMGPALILQRRDASDQRRAHV